MCDILSLLTNEWNGEVIKDVVGLYEMKWHIS